MINKFTLAAPGSIVLGRWEGGEGTVMIETAGDSVIEACDSDDDSTTWVPLGDSLTFTASNGMGNFRLAGGFWLRATCTAAAVIRLARFTPITNENIYA